MLNLDGKVAAVTVSAGGIGAEVARTLARARALPVALSAHRLRSARSDRIAHRAFLYL